MAHISRFFFLRHLRAEPTSHVLAFRGGSLVRSGRGLAFWFWPLTTSLSEVPVDDRDLQLLLHTRTRDFQGVVVSGVVTWRAADPERVASRVDFSLDPLTGRHREDPLEQVADHVAQLARQLIEPTVVSHDLRDLLELGTRPVRESLVAGLHGEAPLAELGIEIVSVRVGAVRPTAELDKALGQPARERIQQQADEATFARRALAVENERAIQENELQNRIELAVREEKLIAQDGANARRKAGEEAEARRIAVEAKAARTRIEAGATAERITAVEGARVDAERDRMGIYRDLSGPVLLGLAARELATNLERIDHLNVSPELLGPLLSELLQAGTARLSVED